jgi:putative flippase GtrA
MRIYNEYTQLVLFFIVGGVNTLFGYSLYALLLFLHLHYALASLTATVGGVLFNFKTTGVIVFKNRDNSLVFKFVGIYVFTYLLNVLGLKLFSTYGANMYLAGAVLILPMALLGYVLQKKYVFGGEKDEAYQRNNPLFQRGR